MIMKFTNTAFVVLLAGVLALAACGGSGSPEAEEMADQGEGVIGDTQPEASPEAMAAAASLTARLENSEVVLVATQRGSAPIDYTQPRATREANFIVTTFLVRNQSDNALAGFQVDEFWFDADGNTVTGDRVRFRQPIMNGEVVEVELRVPRNPAMDRSNYEFSHQNGDIEPNLVEELPEPEAEEEGEEEEAEAEPAA
jgi:hypothetical protein